MPRGPASPVPVLIPQGKIAMGKLAQALMHGAKIIQIDGNFDDCLEMARKLTADYPTILAGQQRESGAHRRPEDGGVRDRRRPRHRPDVHSLPVGNAGNITAYWRGYTEYHRDGVTDKLPRMLGTQAAGAAPLVLGKAGQPPRNAGHRDPDRFAGVLGRRRHRPAGVERPLLAATDEEILAAYHLVAESEGCSSSRPRRPASPGCSSRSRTAGSNPVPRWSAPSPATG